MAAQIINGLWIGAALGPLQLLTIKSFIANGCEFHLWTYNSLTGVLPSGLKIRDANEIISRDSVFCYPTDSEIDVPFGKGSYAGFSDVFRYKLLHELGG